MNSINSTFNWRGVIATILLGLIVACPALADTSLSKDQVLSALEKKYSGQSFQVRYTQISRLSALDITEKATGTAVFSHPGKMKWTYETPDNNLVITNGRTLWIYRPAENQVMTGNAEQYFKSGAGGAFLSDISLIRKNFEIAVKEETPRYIELDLVNKTPNAQISSIVLRVSKTTWEIERVVTYNPYDDTTLFDFYNSQFLTVEPDLFEFKIPENVVVLEME